MKRIKPKPMSYFIQRPLILDDQLTELAYANMIRTENYKQIKEHLRIAYQISWIDAAT